MKKTKISILYEDDFLLAVNKPPCIASVPAENFPLAKTLLGIVQAQCAGRDFRPYLLHRLDYETSGLVLLGKYECDREKLENIFRHSDTRKIYVALLAGIPRGHVIRAELRARHTNVNVPAETHFKILEIFRVRIFHDRPPVPCVFVEIEMRTGRKHQIRQHFAGISCPVILDREYGDSQFNRKFRSSYGLSRQFLHAARINFSHPMSGKIVEIEAPVAPDLISCVKKMVSI